MSKKDKPDKQHLDFLSHDEERAIASLLEAVSDYTVSVHKSCHDPFEIYAQWLEMKFFGDRQALSRKGLRGYLALLQFIAKEQA